MGKGWKKVGEDGTIRREGERMGQARQGWEKQEKVRKGRKRKGRGGKECRGK